MDPQRVSAARAKVTSLAFERDLKAVLSNPKRRAFQVLKGADYKPLNILGSHPAFATWRGRSKLLKATLDIDPLIDTLLTLSGSGGSCARALSKLERADAILSKTINNFSNTPTDRTTISRQLGKIILAADPTPPKNETVECLRTLTNLLTRKGAVPPQ